MPVLSAQTSTRTILKNPANNQKAKVAQKNILLVVLNIGTVKTSAANIIKLILIEK